MSQSDACSAPNPCRVSNSQIGLGLKLNLETEGFLYKFKQHWKTTGIQILLNYSMRKKQPLTSKCCSTFVVIPARSRLRTYLMMLGSPICGVVRLKNLDSQCFFGKTMGVSCKFSIRSIEIHQQFLSHPRVTNAHSLLNPIVNHPLYIAINLW